MSKEMLLRFAIDTAEGAGKVLGHHFRKAKPLRLTRHGIKTTYDELTDVLIKRSIEKRFPTHSYLTEETGLVLKDQEYLWVIDPLDGTNNFINHNPFFAVSVALWQKGRPILGVIEAPALGERFVAVSGKGAWRYDFWKKKRIAAQVSRLRRLEETYILYCDGSEKNPIRIVKIFSALYPRALRFRSLGSAALELCWVGTGRADAYLTTKISWWDIAAGALFIKEAGGKILHFDGAPYDWDEFSSDKKFDILATNGKAKITLDV